MESGKIVLGVLAGLAVGAVLGIMLAPESGEKTRRQILHKGEDFANSLRGKFDELIANLEGEYEKARQVAEKMISEGENTHNDMRKEVKNVV